MSIERRFEEIERRLSALEVAGGSTREDGCSSEAGGFLAAESAVSTPATDPAPVTIKETIAGTVLRMEQGYTGGMNDLSVTPATNPAPDVCEWKRVDEDTLESGCDPDGLTNSPKIYWDECPSCGKPIKFTEAKT